MASEEGIASLARRRLEKIDREKTRSGEEGGYDCAPLSEWRDSIVMSYRGGAKQSGRRRRGQASEKKIPAGWRALIVENVQR